MNLFQYADKMAALDSPMAYVGMGLVAAFTLFILLKMLFAMRRGVHRQLLHTGFVIVAVVAAFFLTAGIVPAAVNEFDEEKLIELINEMNRNGLAVSEQTKEILITIGPDTAVYTLALPLTVLFSPIIFLVTFFVFNFVLRIVYAILAFALRLEKRPKSQRGRCASVFVAAIEAIIVALVLVLPVSNLLSIADVAFDSIIDGNGGDEETAELEEVYVNYINPLTANPAIEFVDTFGGNAVTTAFSTIEINGKKTNLRTEVITAAGAIIEKAEMLGGSPLSSPTDEAKRALHDIVSVISDSPYLSNILTGCIRGIAKAIETNVIDFEVEPAYEEFITDIILFLETLTPESLKSDASTVLSAYFILAEDGIIEALGEGDGANITNIIAENRKQGKDTMTRLLGAFRKNPRTSKLVTALTSSLISSLSGTIEGVEVTYDTLKSEVTNVLAINPDDFETKEEYIEELSNTLDEAFKNNNIEIEKEVVDTIAEYIDENYAAVEDLTDDEFNDILLHYFSAYTEYLANGNGGGEGNGGDSTLPENPSLPNLPDIPELPGTGGDQGGADGEAGGTLIPSFPTNPDGGTEDNKDPFLPVIPSNPDIDVDGIVGGLGAEVGKVCPAIDLSAYGDAVFNLNHYRGQVVVLHFYRWDRNDPSSDEELSHFNAAAYSFSDSCRVVAINSYENADLLDYYVERNFPDGYMTFAQDTYADAYFKMLGGVDGSCRTEEAYAFRY